MKIYKVGGCVRDEQLGLTPTDIDYVVVGSDTKTMLELGFIQVGKDFPVFLHPKTHEEYALARQERKYKPGHQGFIVEATKDISLVDDLKRRDITINAMAKDLISGELIDPFNGRSDLNHQLIRHISPAFTEDPLRILRVARFAAKFNFTIAKETLHLMQTMVNNQELASLSKERIWLEVSKALLLHTPLNFFKNLHLVGANAYVFNSVIPLLNSSSLSQNYMQIDCASLSLEYSFIVLCYFMDIAYQGSNINLDALFKSATYIPRAYRELARLFITTYPVIKQLTTLSTSEIYKLSLHLKLTHKKHKLEVIKDIIIILNETKKDHYLNNLKLLYAINRQLTSLNYATIIHDKTKHIDSIKQQQLLSIHNILDKDTKNAFK